MIEDRRFKRERVAPLSAFDRESMRIVTRGTHRLVVGCPRGKYDSGNRSCGGATDLQAILHPVSESNPCRTCDKLKLGWRF